MTQVIWNATIELQDLEMGFNLYQMKLSYCANLIFALIFAVLAICHFFRGLEAHRLFRRLFSTWLCFGNCRLHN